jgi:signal peptidase
MTDELSRVTVVGRVGNIIVTTLMILVLGLAAVVVVIPRAMGATNLTVLTGSMQPAINPGDLVVVRPTPAENLAVGDIITFQPYSGNPMLITHRITSMTFEAGVVTGIVTQGDANNAADRMIQPAQVMGRVIYTIPWLGHLTTGTGVFIIFGAIGASLVGYSIFTIFRKEPQASPATAASSDTPVEAL